MKNAAEKFLKTTGFAMALLSAGCATAETPTNNEEQKTISLEDVKALKQCQQTTLNCMRVNVYFEKTILATGREAWCPTAIDEPVVFLKNSKGLITHIEWHAMYRNSESRTATALNKKDYWVIFTPFQRKENKVDKFVGAIDAKRGVAISDPIASSFQQYFDMYEDNYPMEFKYSIVAKECRERPLDPRIRVHY